MSGNDDDKAVKISVSLTGRLLRSIDLDGGKHNRSAWLQDAAEETLKRRGKLLPDPRLAVLGQAAEYADVYGEDELQRLLAEDIARKQVGVQLELAAQATGTEGGR